jgi:hypothetical protein
VVHDAAGCDHPNCDPLELEKNEPGLLYQHVPAAAPLLADATARRIEVSE